MSLELCSLKGWGAWEEKGPEVRSLVERLLRCMGCLCRIAGWDDHSASFPRTLGVPGTQDFQC